MSRSFVGPRPLRSLSHLALALLTGAALAACGGGTGPDYGNGGGDEQEEEQCSGDIVMTNNTFSPETDTVSVGTTVTWCNQNGVTHTVTADDGGFDSGDMAPNQTHQETFNSAGTIRYHCTYHGAAETGMHGTLVVE